MHDPFHPDTYANYLLLSHLMKMFCQIYPPTEKNGRVILLLLYLLLTGFHYSLLT